MRLGLKSLVVAAWGCTLSLVGQTANLPFKVNTTELTQELQKQSRGEGFKLIWWIPTEFWVASSPQMGPSSPLIKALDPYILMGVIDGSVSPLGTFSYRPEEEIRKMGAIVDEAGNRYHALDPAAISGDMKNLIGMIRPILTNAMGEMGKNFVFLVFPKHGKDRKPLVIPTGQGRFHYVQGDEDFYWRLPIAALSPKVKCDQDAELFPSNFKFCPFHGGALVAQDKQASGK